MINELTPRNRAKPFLLLGASGGFADFFLKFENGNCSFNRFRQQSLLNLKKKSRKKKNQQNAGRSRNNPQKINPSEQV